jgi:hypothetical protein
LPEAVECLRRDLQVLSEKVVGLSGEVTTVSQSVARVEQQIPEKKDSEKSEVLPEAVE